MENTINNRLEIKWFGKVLTNLAYYYESPYNRHIKDNIYTAFHEYETQCFDKTSVTFDILNGNTANIHIRVSQTGERYLIHVENEGEIVSFLKDTREQIAHNHDISLLKTYKDKELAEECVWSGKTGKYFLSLSFCPPHDSRNKRWRWTVQYRAEGENCLLSESCIHRIQAYESDLLCKSGNKTTKQLINWLKTNFRGKNILADFKEYCVQNAIRYQLITSDLYRD